MQARELVVEELVERPVLFRPLALVVVTVAFLVVFVVALVVLAAAVAAAMGTLARSAPADATVKPISMSLHRASRRDISPSAWSWAISSAT